MELLGLAVFFAVLAVAIPGIVTMQKSSLMQLRASTTAEQFDLIAKAADSYIQSNYTSLVASGGGTITVPQLENAGFLQPLLSDVNPYGGSWVVEVSEPSLGYLQGLLMTEGGIPLKQDELGTIIAQTHGMGGEVPPAGVSLNGQVSDGNTAIGAYGGWSVNLNASNNPGPGHLVGLLSYYNGSTQENDFLYRVSVPNNPQFNQMSTNLSMDNHSISGADNITSASINTTTGNFQALSSNSITTKTLTANQIIANSEILSGGNVNGMPGSLQIGNSFLYGDQQNSAIRQNGSFYIQHDDGSLADLNAANINASQNVNAANMSASQNITANGYVKPGNIATSGQWCQTNGEVGSSSDGSGQILSCTNNQWSSINTPGIVNLNTTTSDSCTIGSVGIGNYEIETYYDSPGIFPSWSNQSIKNAVQQIETAEWDVGMGSCEGGETSFAVFEAFCFHGSWSQSIMTYVDPLVTFTPVDAGTNNCGG